MQYGVIFKRKDLLSEFQHLEGKARIVLGENCLALLDAFKILFHKVVNQSDVEGFTLN